MGLAGLNPSYDCAGGRRRSTYRAPWPPCGGWAGAIASTCRRSSGSWSQRGTALFNTPPLERPWPVMTSTQRRPAAREAATNPVSARCASVWVMPCRSSRASIGRRPRRNRSAVARSTPAKRSSGGAGGCCGLAGAAVAEPVLAPTRPPLGDKPPPCPPPLAGEGSAGSGGGLLGNRRARGATLRATRRHSSASSDLRRRILDQYDMEAARPVRAQLDALLDVAGARRAGDQVDGAG